MVYRTKTYIAGDWTGDKDAIDKLYSWKKSDFYNLDFVDAHEFHQSNDKSFNCSIKDNLRVRMDGSKKFVLIVMSPTFIRFKQWLGRLSFRTGIVVATLCVISYIVSFTQMLLPVSATTKGVLWVVFFGLAKTFQYAALLILGTAGLTRIKAIFKYRK